MAICGMNGNCAWKFFMKRQLCRESLSSIDAPENDKNVANKTIQRPQRI
jgi:hypothetical protein